MQTRKPLRIEVPKDEGGKLARVGLIAVVGFAVGILWPRLAGFRLVPSVPTEKTEASAEAPSADASAAPAAAAPVAAAEPAQTPEAAAPASKENFSVGSGEVASCRDGKKKQEQCDPIDFDGVARGRIATLAACDAANDISGVLSLGFELDFEKDRVTGVQAGKSTSLTQKDTDALLGCLKQNLGEVALAGIHHKHERYTVYYKVEFKAPQGDDKKPIPEAAADAAPASGKATVAWDVALVRSGPARDKDVVARVLQGTRVNVVARSGDWYRVKYDAKGNEGWVFRTAIGM
ncbi:MAG TPA: SH3 domain-containing protein [Polyangiaceae bacterium]|nr:SH3 domain-containing protein [Polyangiaceae bacterium]